MNNALVNLACAAVLAGISCAGAAALLLSHRLGWASAALLLAGCSCLAFVFN